MALVVGYVRAEVSTAPARVTEDVHLREQIEAVISALLDRIDAGFKKESERLLKKKMALFKV